VLPLQIASLVATPIMWTEAGKCKQALADHLASLVNNEEWADVEFVLDADGDKRIFGCPRPLPSYLALAQLTLGRPVVYN
jgi:hypothetical protein